MNKNKFNKNKLNKKLMMKFFNKLIFKNQTLVVKQNLNLFVKYVLQINLLINLLKKNL